MSFRILILDTNYGSFLHHFHATRGALANERYESIRRRLLDAHFGTGDFYSRHLVPLGCVVEEVVPNDEILQKTWATEHGVRLRFQIPGLKRIPFLRRWAHGGWVYPILAAQIANFRPDILYVQNISYFKPGFLREMKDRTGCRVVGQIASRMPPLGHFDPYDLLLSSLPNLVERFRSWGKTAEYLALAFEASLVRELVTTDTRYDVTHIGGYGGVHAERTALLEAVSQRVPIDCWGYDGKHIPEGSPLRARFHGPVWGRAMYQVRHDSRVSITKHISEASGYANNMTLFEATGAGSLLITDWKENLSQLFDVGREIESYRSPDELVEKIRYYLGHEPERSGIAAAGQRRTLSDHNYERRMKELLDILRRQFGPR